MRKSKESITKSSKKKLSTNAKISALSSRNVGKYEPLSDKDVLPEKALLVKAFAIKRFEYSSLGSNLKKQTDIAKKLCQGLDKVFSFNKDNKNQNEPIIKKEAVAKTLTRKNIISQINLQHIWFLRL